MNINIDNFLEHLACSETTIRIRDPKFDATTKITPHVSIARCFSFSVENGYNYVRGAFYADDVQEVQFTEDKIVLVLQ